MSSPEQFRAVVYNAARDGNMSRLEIFFQHRNKEWFDVVLNGEDNDKPALVIASREGHLNVVKYLVSKGADPSTRGTVSFDGETIYGSPPLWAAAAAGHFEVTRFLVEHAGANINQTTHTNSTPLRGACYDGHLGIVKYLVDNGADFEIPNRHGHTPLMIAAYRQKKDVVEYLLARGANPSVASKKGNTALHDAAEANNADICEVLLLAGATLAQDDFGVCPLMSAAMLGHCEVMPLLMTYCPSKRVQRDAFKMVGATLVDKKMDHKGATDFWREALLIDLGDEQAEEYAAAAMRKVHPVYEFAEIHTLADLDAICIVPEPDAVRMQALIIRERILGGGHAEVHYYLRFRGAVYCDMGMVDRCFALWMHALDLQQEHLCPLHASTMQTFLAFQETFTLGLDEHVINQLPARAPLGVTGEQVADVFERTTKEIERLVSWGERPLFEECCGEDHEHDVDGEKERLVLTALQLLHLINRVALPIHALPRDRPPEPPSLEECAANEAPVDVERLVLTCRQANLRPLHVACTSRDELHESSFPQFYVVERLIRAGVDVRERDSERNTALHALLASTADRSSIARLLIENGAPILARNSKNETCLEMLHDKLPSLVRQIPMGQYISLVGLAANAVHRHEVQFEDLLPRDMHAEMQLY